MKPLQGYLWHQKFASYTSHRESPACSIKVKKAVESLWQKGAKREGGLETPSPCLVPTLLGRPCHPIRCQPENQEDGVFLRKVNSPQKSLIYVALPGGRTSALLQFFLVYQTTGALCGDQTNRLRQKSGDAQVPSEPVLSPSGRMTVAPDGGAHCCL